MEKVKISTDWTLVRGTDIAESLIIKLIQNEDDFEKIKSSSKLDDIVSFERSIHLQPNNKNTNNDNSTLINCEINFNILPKFIGNSITIITDCQKAEIFTSLQKEYLNTIFGDFLDDFDGMQVYRHDIEIQKSKSFTNLTVKLIPKDSNLWIYGMQIVLKNNPNPQSTSSINLDNVQNMINISNQKLSPSAERCKLFVQNYMLANRSSNNFSEFFGADDSANIQNLINLSNCGTNPLSNETNNSNFDPTLKLNGNICQNLENLTYNKIVNELKLHIDLKLLETENKIFKRIEEFEKIQNEKINQILEILKK